MNIADFKIGLTVYVPVVDKLAKKRLYDHYANRDEFYKYRILELKIKHIRESIENNENITYVLFDMDDLTFQDRQDILSTYGYNGLYPCMNFGFFDDREERDYFKFYHNSNENNYDTRTLKEMFTLNKEDAQKVLENKKEKELAFVKNMIEYYQNTYPIIEKWLNDENFNEQKRF